MRALIIAATLLLVAPANAAERSLAEVFKAACIDTDAEVARVIEAAGRLGLAERNIPAEHNPSGSRIFDGTIDGRRVLVSASAWYMEAKSDAPRSFNRICGVMGKDADGSQAVAVGEMVGVPAGTTRGQTYYSYIEREGVRYAVGLATGPAHIRAGVTGGFHLILVTKDGEMATFNHTKSSKAP